MVTDEHALVRALVRLLTEQVRSVPMRAPAEVGAVGGRLVLRPIVDRWNAFETRVQQPRMTGQFVQTVTGLEQVFVVEEVAYEVELRVRRKSR